VTCYNQFLTSQTVRNGERLRTEFRADFFNLFNLANINLPENNVAASGTFCVISRTTGNPRIIQVAAKFIFWGFRWNTNIHNLVNQSPWCWEISFSLWPAFRLWWPAAEQKSEQKSNIHEIRLTEGTNMAIALSPDGREIVFDLQGTLWKMPVTGGKATALSDELGDIRQPAWSPDGKNIVFQSYCDGN
jgi:hypothetical protein